MNRSIASVVLLSSAWLGVSSHAQLAPAGFTGTINTPTADVMTIGTVQGSVSNNNPEKIRSNPDAGNYGSLNLGFGVIEGLELVGRLAYEGDLHCSMYNTSCPAGMRDLSASAKYQFPLRLPGNTRLAIGANDVGGAATNFRSYYSVATSSAGPLDLSLGYGKGRASHASLDGVFGSAQVLLTEHVRALAEYEQHHWRAGLRYERALSDQWSVAVNSSRQLSKPDGRQTWQTGLGFTYSFERPNLQKRSEQPNLDVARASSENSSVGQIEQTAVAKVNSMVATTESMALRAQGMAEHFADKGFASVSVGFDDETGWVIQAEPLAWRKSRMDALGMALAIWQRDAHSNDRLKLVLTYLQQPVVTATTSLSCLQRFGDGQWLCDGKAALVLDNGERAASPAQGWLVQSHGWTDAWRPQIELGPALSQRVGTEYGLYDASAGVSVGWELPLAKGLLWQAEVTKPVTQSKNFEQGQVYGDDRIQDRLQTNMVSWESSIAQRAWARASVGYVQHHDTGGQIDLAWMRSDGRLRLSAMAGRYQSGITRGWNLDEIVHAMGVASARWTVTDGRWFVEAQGGQFYNQDRGFKLASHHWFGDTRFSLMYRDTHSDKPYYMPRTRFAGFQIALPLGPKQAASVGPLTIRGTDHWNYGIESKVGANDNYITGGYGVVPSIRHSLLADTLDYDRAGVADMTANLYLVRAILLEQTAHR